MKRIFKYAIETANEQFLMIPSLPGKNFKDQVLSVEVQHSTPYMWVLVDDQCEPVKRSIKIRGTGHPCDDIQAEEYIGSYQLFEGNFVGHVFAR